MRDTTDNLVSHLLGLGYFDAVNTVEPKAPPDNGFHAAVIFQSAQLLAEQSGLGKGTALYTLLVRVYRNMLAEPDESIDPDLLDIGDAVWDALGGDFELGGTVRNIDLLGASGTPLSNVAGYIQVGSNMYRSLDITVPLVVNDVVTFTA